MNLNKYRLAVVALLAVLLICTAAVKPNVRGSVRSTTGKPVPGVVVTDGVQTALTDAAGNYAMASDLKLRNFIYFSLPDGYEMPSYEGLARFYEKVDHFADTMRVDFTLAPRAGSSAKHTIFMVGDPQIKQVGSNGSAETYANATVPSLARKAKAIAGPVYCMTLGDVMHNDMTVYDFYIDNHAKIGVTGFHLIGNHDFVQTAVRDTLADAYYEMNLGPVNYSFNIGKMHYIVLKDMIFDRPDIETRYGSGLTDATLAWMEEDLRHVPSDRTIMLCAHSPLFRKGSSYSTASVNYKRYVELLRRFKQVHAWAGHVHEQYNYVYQPSDNWIDDLESHTLTRVTGALYFNTEINSDGSPQGYTVVEVDGDRLSWYFQPCLRDEPWEYKAYSPERTLDGTVVVNAWNADALWRIEWQQAGGEWVAMEQFTGQDCDAVALAREFKKTTPKVPFDVSNTPHLYRVTPSAGVKKGTVRVTDRFGRVYQETLVWN